MCHQKRALLACMFMFPTFYRTPAMLKSYAGVSPGLYPAILGKGALPKLGKNYQLNVKIGKNNDIKHNDGSKVYPKNIFFFRWVFYSHKW